MATVARGFGPAGVARLVFRNPKRHGLRRFWDLPVLILIVFIAI